MSHVPYNEQEESFLSDTGVKGWQCPKCKSIWAPSVKKCESKACVQASVQETSEAPDTRKFLTE